MSDKSKLSPASAGFPSTSKDNNEVLGQERQDLEHKDSFIMKNSNSSTEDDSFDTTTSSDTDDSITENDCSGLIPGIEDADPDLHSDSVEKLKKAFAKLKSTRRENGAQGGRPLIDRSGLARVCVNLIFANHDEKLLRHYAGSWFSYTDGKYKRIKDEEVEKKVTGFLTQVSQLKGAVTTSLVRDVLNIMKSDEYCGLTETDFQMPCFISTGADASRFLPMQNGILDIEATLDAMSKGESLPALLPTTPDLFSVHGLDYDYDPMAECPRFLQYLEGVQPNPENRVSLQMLAGLLLVQDCSYNVAFFFYGEGGTGKSVCMNVLEGLLGAENCCSVPLANLGDRFAKIRLTENMANLVGRYAGDP